MDSVPFQSNGAIYSENENKDHGQIFIIKYFNSKTNYLAKTLTNLTNSCD